jgi:acyl-coenzyme A thioesterase PaaI-like protein
MKITDLPFNAFIGLIPSKRAGYALSLPADPNYANHLGTVHASALLALAEATSGDYLLTRFPEIAFEVVPVVRRLEAKFKKPAIGELYALATAADTSRVEFIATLTTRGRALLAIDVEVHDSAANPVLAVTAEWFVAKQS